MIVSGTVSTKMAERMTRLYEQMPEPKWVIAMGACAISGGPFLDGYSVLMGADRVIPVDVYVPGCPPRPEALIFGIMTLQKKIERDQQVGYERPRPALVTEDGEFLEYLPEREYTNISEGKAPRFENIRPLKRTYVFEREGMPPASQTDVGWIPKEVKKKLKEQQRPRRPPPRRRRRRTARRTALPRSLPTRRVQPKMAVTLPEGDLNSRLEQYLEGFRNRHGLEESEIEGNVVRLVVEPGLLPAVLRTAKERLGVLHLSFITVVDREGSFELTYELLDLRGGQVRVKTIVEGEEPVIDTVTGIYPTANWHEREAYDMFGIAFKGHPDLRRLYMWQDHFDHHPLLKSFEISTKRTFENLR
jgi:NADH:ubiquinone oxidoreductase subunit C